MIRNNIIFENVSIETQTSYSENGRIDIYPCAFEDNPHLVINGNTASQKGRMITEDDGTSCFHPYATNSGSRYSILHNTQHGEVKETKLDYIFTLRFPKKLGKEYIEAKFSEETGEQSAFISTLPSETIGPDII